MQNEFINAPLLVRQQPDPKDELIKALELKNAKLKTQLLKIQRTIEERFEGGQQDEAPKKRESIFQWEESLEVLNKELANSYKKIKMYEYEIAKLEEGAGRTGGSVTQKASQVELIIKEKKMMAEKLKAQLAKEQKITQENTRRLSNNSQREQLDANTKKLAEEAKFYKQKVRFFQQAQTLKATNMKKQHQAIKKFQNQLLEAGMAGGELEQLKQKVLRSIKARQTHQDPANNENESANEHSEEQVEDRTREHYEALMGEAALLQKMLRDHQRQFAEAEEDRQEAIGKNMASRNRLLECENEIENLQKEIAVMKGKVIPSNLKPLNPLRSLSSQQGNAQKLLPAKPTPKAKALPHLLKFDQAGIPSPKGQRFTDRILLGKNNLSARITAVKVFIERVSGLIGGIQVSYEGKRGGQHVKRDKQAKQKQYSEEELACKGHTIIRSISGTLSSDEKIESLLVTASDGSSQKFGTIKTPQKHFNLQIGSDEFPTCVFGTLLVIKEPGKREYSILEHLGFQIQNQSHMSSHSASLNEFND